MSLNLSYNIERDKFGGSQIFADLTKYTGLTNDKQNFLISQIVALGLGTLYRTLLHPAKVSSVLRHLYGLVFGLLIGGFCFGLQVMHLVILSAICFVLTRTRSPHTVHWTVLVASLVYLSCIQVHRCIYDYGSHGMHVSGPLMVLTQKVSSLAYSLHDGLTKREEEMTGSQRKFAVNKQPSLLEYFSYALLFPGIIVGPLIFYNDYIDFINGASFRVCEGGCTEEVVVASDPSPAKAVCKKLVLSTLFAAVFIKFQPIFPINRILDENVTRNAGTVYKISYAVGSISLFKFKYYCAWTLADAVCNNCGMGFSGYNPDGSTNWDKLSNIDVFQFECATSLKHGLDAWNKGTNDWLRFLAYDRTKSYRLFLTYGLSAIWHGLYPAYYLTFFSLALFTASGRIARRHFRNYFMASNGTQLFYDILTFIVTRTVMGYAFYPFVSLEFWGSFVLYNGMYWYPHLLAAAVILVVPKCVPKTAPKELSNRNDVAIGLRQVDKYISKSL